MATIPKPHPKQLEVINSPQRYKVLVWARRCFTGDTLISLADGTQLPLSQVTKGMMVYTLNEDGRQLEPKEVLQTYHYGIDIEPKAMLRLVINGEELTSTYDHEYYSDGQWIPAYQLAWRAMAPSQRQKLKLLCEQYGETLDDISLRRIQDGSDETITRRFWVLANNGRWPHDKDAPISSTDLDSKSTREATGEPHQQHQDGQPNRKPGVGDESGEPSTHDESGTTDQERWGEMWDAHPKGTSSAGDTDVSTGTPRDEQALDVETISKRLSRQAGDNSPYFERQNLEVSSVEVLECQDSYDIHVEDNHNYIANGILVHNTGKSTFAGLYTLMKALQHQGNYYIVAPTERQAKSIYWNDILQLVIPKELIAKVNNVERTITFHHIHGDITLPDGTVIHVEHDENKPPSTISLRGVDNPDALRGVKLAGCVLDEYAFMENAKYVFDAIISPALADQEGWAIFISTPNGIHNPFYDLAKTAKKEDNDYFYSHATALDNPYFPQQEFYRQRERYIEEGKLDAFVQEWQAEFKTPSRLVYRAFDEDIHVVKPSEIPKEGTYAMGIDFGWVDPFAVIFVLIDYEQNWWIYDEIYLPELTTDKALRIIQDKMGDKHFSRIIGDAQGKTDIANFKEKKFYITPSRKGDGSIKSGIREVASFLELREVRENGIITQKPRLHVSSVCRNWIKEAESYSHRTDAYGEPTETPEDKNNHLMDATRYLITDYTQSRKPRVRAKRTFDPRSGRMLS